METNPSGTVSYTTDSNSLITAVSELQEYIFSNRSVSAVNTGDGDQDGAYKADRNINTGYISLIRVPFQIHIIGKLLLKERSR